MSGCSSPILAPSPTAVHDRGASVNARAVKLSVINDTNVRRMQHAEHEALSVARLLDVFNMHCAAKVARVQAAVGQAQEALQIYDVILPKLAPSLDTLTAENMQQRAARKTFKYWRHHADEQACKLEPSNQHTQCGESLMIGARERGMLLSDAAGVMRQLHRQDEAVILYARALGELEHAFGGSFAPAATVHNNLGAVFLHTGDIDGALHHFVLAHAIRKRNFGTDHPATLQCIRNLASAHMQGGDPAVAQYLLKQLEKG